MQLRAHFFGFLARVSQTVHCRTEFCLCLGQLVVQLGFALLQVGDRLIACLFRFVQLLAHPVKLRHIICRDTRKAVNQPVGKPTDAEGNEKHDRRCHDELGATQRAVLLIAD